RALMERTAAGSLRHAARRRAGVAGQHSPGLPAVRGDLCLQRRQPVKLLLRPQEVDQRHSQVPAIEIAGEIEEMDLELHPRAADRRAAAEIGHTVTPDRAAALVDAGLDGIDAERGLEIAGDRQIGGGKAQRAATAVALLDTAFDLPGAAEQR